MYQDERKIKWVLASPLIIFLIILVLFPAIYGIYSSTQDLTIRSDIHSFIGLENYISVLKNDVFWKSIGFTFYFTIITTIIEIVLGFGLALLFDRVFPGKKLLLSLILLPIMVAPSLMGIMLRLILNENIGLITYLFSLFDITVNLFDPDMIVPLLIILDIVQWVPFTFLILYSGLQTVDSGLYEAAAIDGASYIKTLFKVIIPIISPIIFIAAFLRGIDAFRTFDVIYVLTNGGPGTSTTTASIFIYKTAFKDGNFGEASAASIIIVLMLLAVMSFMIKRLGIRKA